LILAAISDGTWAFLGVLITNGVILVGLFRRVGRQGQSMEMINRAVNHQEPGASTLIDRVITVERRTEEIARETAEHRRWQDRMFTALAHHVGMTLPRHDDDSHYIDEAWSDGR
jgi:hypothetical protein